MNFSIRKHNLKYRVLSFKQRLVQRKAALHFIQEKCNARLSLKTYFIFLMFKCIYSLALSVLPNNRLSPKDNSRSIQSLSPWVNQFPHSRSTETKTHIHFHPKSAEPFDLLGFSRQQNGCLHVQGVTKLTECPSIFLRLRPDHDLLHKKLPDLPVGDRQLQPLPIGFSPPGQIPGGKQHAPDMTDRIIQTIIGQVLFVRPSSTRSMKRRTISLPLVLDQ